MAISRCRVGMPQPEASLGSSGAGCSRGPGLCPGGGDRRWQPEEQGLYPPHAAGSPWWAQGQQTHLGCV